MLDEHKATKREYFLKTQ